MKTNQIGIFVVALTALVANAQPSAPFHLNDPYSCRDGMSITVTACAQQAGQDYCAFKIEQKGKLAFQGVNLQKQVATAVKQCTTQAASPSPQSTAKPAPWNGKPLNPAYLSEMPSVERVLEGMKTSDPHETALRQVWAFYELTEIIKTLSGSREFRGLLPDEQKILGEYQVAQYNTGQAADKNFPKDKPSEYLTYHFSRWDPRFGFNGINIWQFFSEDLQSQYTKIVGADNARYAAMRAEQRRIAAQGVSANPQASGSPFVRNDPGTLAARRCVELGGNELECVGKGFWTGLIDMAGVNPDDLSGPERAGVVMNGPYQAASGLELGFGLDTVSVSGCGKLIPDGHSYTITKRPNQLLIQVGNVPSSFVLTMGNDGKLIGPGPIDVKGQIITGYERVWMQEYRNNIPVSGSGYWDNRPIYGPKTERCAIGTLAQAPPPPPDKNPLTSGITSTINSVMHLGPSGLRMNGHYMSQGGLALEFAADGVVLDCGAAHVRQPYVVENTPNQLLVTVNNGASPFTLAVQPNGTLAGSGSADVVGRVVTGSTQNEITYASKTGRCAIGTVVPKGGTTTAQIGH